MVVEWLVPLWRGFGVTIQFFILTLVLSIPLGMFLAVANRIIPKPLQFILNIYVTIFRGTPLLLQMLFIFFGLADMNIVLGRFEAALVTLVLNYTAYFIEIFRGGIQSIPQGQYEAMKVLSLPPIIGWWKLILPQVIRIVMPSIGNEVINLIKDTALIYALGLEDLLKVGKALANQNATLLPYLYVGIIYLLFTSIMTLLLRQIENKLGVRK